MIWRVSLVLLLLAVTQCAMGFSRVTVAKHQAGRMMRSASRLAFGRLASSDAWNPWGTTSDDEDEREMAAKREYDNNLFVVAAIPPALALVSYEWVSRALAYFFDLMGFQSFANVDGNAFATNLLRPTLNGVVGEYYTLHDS